MVWTRNHEILPSAKGQKFSSSSSVKVEVFMCGGDHTRRRKRSYEKPVSIQEGDVSSEQERNPSQCKAIFALASQFEARKTQQGLPKII